MSEAKLTPAAGSAISEMHLGTMSEAAQRRCLEIGKRVPSMRWWYSPHEKLGCSPRDAVDAGRFADVEALLPNAKAQPAAQNP